MSDVCSSDLLSPVGDVECEGVDVIRRDDARLDAIDQGVAVGEGVGRRLAAVAGIGVVVREVGEAALPVGVRRRSLPTGLVGERRARDRKSTRLNSSPLMRISYAVLCLK